MAPPTRRERTSRVGTNVVECTLKGLDGIGAGLLTAAFECAIDERLGDGALSVKEDLVDQLGDNWAP